MVCWFSAQIQDHCVLLLSLGIVLMSYKSAIQDSLQENKMTHGERQAACPVDSQAILNKLTSGPTKHMNNFSLDWWNCRSDLKHVSGLGQGHPGIMNAQCLSAPPTDMCMCSSIHMQTCVHVLVYHVVLITVFAESGSRR